MTSDRSREPTLPIENTGKVCEIPKNSVFTQTHADLCELKTSIDMRHGSPSTLSGMIAFQKELDGIAPREIHENELFLYIQSPLAVQYRVTMKQGSVGTPKNTPFLFTFPDGQQATILRRDENGYNSEYEIFFGDKP